MAFNGLNGSLQRSQGGGNQDAVDRGVFQFDGTALTCTLPVRVSRILPGSQLLPLAGTAAASSAETLTIREAVNTAGYIQVPSSGEVTIARVASGTPTSNLAVFFQLIGSGSNS